MARKEPTKAVHQRGFSDILGILLIAGALLLLLAQLSFDRQDVASNRLPANETTHNWIGSAGAFGANGFFFLFGAGAFVLPVLLMLFGLGHLFEFLSYLKRRWAWAAALFLTCLGFFDLYSNLLETLRVNLNAPSAGGLLGQMMNSLVFGHLGKPGATIIFSTLYLISLIFLTNFRLGPWLRSRLASKPRDETAEANDDKSWSVEEKALARRARDLEKQAKRLQEQLEKDRTKEREKSGLGADLRPVPAPTVRDLSVPNARPGRVGQGRIEDPAIEKGELEGEIISATEIAAASTEEILGRRAEGARKGRGDEVESSRTPGRADNKPEPEREAADKSEPVAGGGPASAPIKITDNTGAGKRPAPRKKPITVASTPLIGNYQLPPLDFLQYPDQTVKPTESKEELMANARLMQQTLAQFDIEVSLGDITKGPTITRYELHPAPGVKLEKIVNLNNN
ncbi:MAG TPA: DNA translocase FtsK 4TM domain-containing protein, partial [Candidatus Binatia bacterium]|nr:DNA translocase FtsK 4TM domain-containing protein [Candidatus Binatia bacterium]